MNMFLTLILKLFTSLPKVSCLSVGPLALGTACAVFLLLAGTSTCLASIIAALTASITAYTMPFLMLWSDATSFYFQALYILCICSYFQVHLLCEFFFFWHHVMLLCHLFCLSGVIMNIWNMYNHDYTVCSSVLWRDSITICVLACYWLPPAYCLLGWMSAPVCFVYTTCACWHELIMDLNVWNIQNAYVHVYIST